MLDLMTATQDAFFAALAEAEMPSGVAVRQHLRQDQQPPWVRVGRVTTNNQANKSGQLEQLTVEVQTIWRGEENRSLFAIMHAVRAALDGQALVSDDVIFSRPRFVNADCDVADDGVTYAGISNFTIFAEPAEQPE